jgi:DNA-binding PadR family transcriptional regulator
MNDLVILAMLADGPKYGYQLKRQAGFISGQGDMHNNLIYPLLRRFTDDGWVTRKSVPGDRGQTRQNYSLTAAGRKELITRLSSFTESDASNARAFLARVGMFELLPPETCYAILDEREKYLRGRAERLGRLTGKIQLGVFGTEVVRHLVKQTRFEVAWIRRLRRTVSGDLRKSPY